MKYDWYYEFDNDSRGPVSEDEIVRLFRSGDINSETFISKDGKGAWAPISEWKEFGFLFSKSNRFKCFNIIILLLFIIISVICFIH